MKYTFKPKDYLAFNPDVAKAVEERRVYSAWGHFVERGFREARPGVPPEIGWMVHAMMGVSIPPPPARVLEGPNGTADFERGARIAALDVYAAAVPVLHLEVPMRILDFGCGYGGMLRFLTKFAPRSKIHGVDMDAEAIAWCNEGYREDVRWGRYAFIAARSGPPLPFSPGYFDLVCGVSIFARMPAGLRLLWLSELRRITRPEGFLVLRESVGTLEKYFTVLNRIPSGVAGEQDLVLCMRHPALVI